MFSFQNSTFKFYFLFHYIYLNSFQLWVFTYLRNNYWFGTLRSIRIVIKIADVKISVVARFYYCLLQSTLPILNVKGDKRLITPPQSDLRRHKYDPFHGVTGFLTEAIEKNREGKKIRYHTRHTILSYLFMRRNKNRPQKYLVSRKRPISQDDVR